MKTKFDEFINEGKHDDIGMIFIVKKISDLEFEFLLDYPKGKTVVNNYYCDREIIKYDERIISIWTTLQKRNEFKFDVEINEKYHKQGQPLIYISVDIPTPSKYSPITYTFENDNVRDAVFKGLNSIFSSFNLKYKQNKIILKYK